MVDEPPSGRRGEDDGPGSRTRRETVLAGGVIVSSSLAGCLSGGSDSTNGNESGDTVDADVPVETLAVDAAFTEPAWAVDSDAPGVVYLYDETPERLFDGLDGSGAVDAFVAETDFDSSVLLQIGSVGPDACADELELGRLDIEGDTLSGTAQVVRSSDGDCGDATSYPWLLVRVGATISTARLTVTDGAGEQRTLGTDTQEGIDPAELTGFVAPGGEPPTVPAPIECATGRRHEQRVAEPAVQLGQATRDGDPQFALTADDTVYERGDTLGVSLRTITPTPRESAGRYSYNLQVLTEAGWQDLRVVTRPQISYPEDTVVHAPGEGFDWSITLTASGLLADHILEQSLLVCPGLVVGRYRFLFWDPAVAVEFDYVG